MRARRGQGVVLGMGAMLLVAAGFAVVGQARGGEGEAVTVGADVRPSARPSVAGGSSPGPATAGPSELPSAGAAVPGPAIPLLNDALRRAADRAVARSVFIDRISGGTAAELVDEGPWTSSDQVLLGIVRQYRLDPPVNTARETWPWVNPETGAPGQPEFRLQVSGLRAFDVLVSNRGEVVQVTPVEHDGTQ